MTTTLDRIVELRKSGKTPILVACQACQVLTLHCRRQVLRYGRGRLVAECDRCGTMRLSW